MRIYNIRAHLVARTIFSKDFFPDGSMNFDVADIFYGQQIFTLYLHKYITPAKINGFGCNLQKR